MQANASNKKVCKPMQASKTPYPFLPKLLSVLHCALFCSDLAYITMLNSYPDLLRNSMALDDIEACTTIDANFPWKAECSVIRNGAPPDTPWMEWRLISFFKDEESAENYARIYCTRVLLPCRVRIRLTKRSLTRANRPAPLIIEFGGASSSHDAY